MQSLMVPLLPLMWSTSPAPDTLTLDLFANDTVVNIAANAKWVGGFNVSEALAPFTVNAGAHASFEAD